MSRKARINYVVKTFKKRLEETLRGWPISTQSVIGFVKFISSFDPVASNLFEWILPKELPGDFLRFATFSKDEYIKEKAKLFLSSLSDFRYNDFPKVWIQEVDELPMCLPHNQFNINEL